MGPLDERSTYDEKLHRILREASAVFADKGYHNASIRDISSATGVSLSGLYYYFRSKEELLFLIQSHCFDTIVEQLQRDLADVPDPTEQLRILIRNHLGFFAANMAEMKVLAHEGETLEGDLGARILTRKKAYAESVLEILSELGPNRSPSELRTATFSLFGMMNWIHTWYRPDRDMSVDALARDMNHIFLRGFAEPLDDIEATSTVPDSSGVEPSIWRSPGRADRAG